MVLRPEFLPQKDSDLCRQPGGLQRKGPPGFAPKSAGFWGQVFRAVSGNRQKQSGLSSVFQENGPDFSSFRKRLLAQTKSLHDSAVSLDVAILQVVEQRTALAHQFGQRPFRSIIFSVELQVLCQMRNTV